MRIFVVLFCAITLCFALDFKDLEGLRDQELQGRFVQTKTLKAFENDIVFEGVFWYNKTEVLWEVQSPIKNVLKITAQGVLEQKDSHWIPLQTSSEKTLFLEMLHLNIQTLEKYFTMQLEGDRRLWNLFLTPKNSIVQKIFKKIQIKGAFAGKNPLIQEIFLEEKGGDITHTKFIVAQ